MDREWGINKMFKKLQEIMVAVEYIRDHSRNAGKKLLEIKI